MTRALTERLLRTGHAVLLALALARAPQFAFVLAPALVVLPALSVLKPVHAPQSHGSAPFADGSDCEARGKPLSEPHSCWPNLELVPNRWAAVAAAEAREW